MENTFGMSLCEAFLSLHYSRCSSRKKVACGPPGMAIKDVPFKRAVRARMPPHVKEPLVTAPQSSSTARPFDLGAHLIPDSGRAPEEVVASPGPRALAGRGSTRAAGRDRTMGSRVVSSLGRQRT